MQMLMQRGMSSGEQKMQGLRDMLEQLRKRKQQQLEKYDLNSLLNDIREKLDNVLQQERQASTSSCSRPKRQRQRMLIADTIAATDRNGRAAARVFG